VRGGGGDKTGWAASKGLTEPYVFAPALDAAIGPDPPDTLALGAALWAAHGLTARRRIKGEKRHADRTDRRTFA